SEQVLRPLSSDAFFHRQPFRGVRDGKLKSTSKIRSVAVTVTVSEEHEHFAKFCASIHARSQSESCASARVLVCNPAPPRRLFSRCLAASSRNRFNCSTNLKLSMSFIHRTSNANHSA